MYIVRNHSQLAVVFGDAENPPSQKNVGVGVQWWEVHPTLPVLEVCSKGECAIASRRAVVYYRLETVV
jgi:hypothetical protein